MVKTVNGVSKVQKVAKSRHLFLIQLSPPKNEINFFVKSMIQILYQKKSWFFQKANIAKMMVNVQKRLKGASVKADFWHGEYIDHADKKKL